MGRKEDVVKEYDEIGNLEREERTACYLRKNRKESVDQPSTGGLEKVGLNPVTGTAHQVSFQYLHHLT